MTLNVYIGIDPGWKNLGSALIQHDTETGLITKLHSQVFCPAKHKNLNLAISEIYNELEPRIPRETNVKLMSLIMERFIAYKGVDSAEFEIINRLIGGIELSFHIVENIATRLERAIDWKMNLVKALHIKKQFENPSDKLDKKFSIAAAKACFDEDVYFKTDHEADAACLACLPIYVPKLTK